MAKSVWETVANYIKQNYKDVEFTKEEITNKYGKIAPATWKALITHQCITDNNNGTFIYSRDEDLGESDWLLNKHKPFSVLYNGVERSGEGEFFDKNDLSALNQYYFAWKNMNEVNRTFGMRRINLPELLSEGLACALIENWVRTNNTIITNATSSGDAIDISTGEIIQIKGISSSKYGKVGPTSFGPKTEWDKLICLHVNCDNDTASFYSLDADYKNFKVNQEETIADQQEQGRRPRLNLLDKIDEFHIQPFLTYQFIKED